MTSKIKKIKLKGNESFNFREGWLRKGMRQIDACPDFFSRSDAMELLGVGSKMAKSIRYWLLATGIAEEKIIENRRTKGLYLTTFGKLLQEFDPYFEDEFTLYLLHYHIVTNEKLCIAWQIFFDEFNGKDFTRDNLNEMSKMFLTKRLEQNEKFSEKSLESDCASIIKMYSVSEDGLDPEDSLACPLQELHLLEKSRNDKNKYLKTSPKKDQLDALAVMYVMVSNLKKTEKHSVSIKDLQEAPGNIGRVFNLDRVLINEYLDQLRIAGYITIVRTAGLNIVDLKDSYKQITPEDIFRIYYKQHLRLI